MISGSYWSLEHVLSHGPDWEPQLTILAFSVNGQLPEVENFAEMVILGKAQDTEMKEGPYWN